MRFPTVAWSESGRYFGIEHGYLVIQNADGRLLLDEQACVFPDGPPSEGGWVEVRAMVLTHPRALHPRRNRWFEVVVL